MIMTEQGTAGFVHTIHVAEPDGDGGWANVKEYENVVDVMRLPGDKLQFHHEGEMKSYDGREIIRSRVKDVGDAFRYRCSVCETFESGIISQVDRGEQSEMDCPVCGEITLFDRMDIDELRYD